MTARQHRPTARLAAALLASTALLSYATTSVAQPVPFPATAAGAQELEARQAALVDTFRVAAYAPAVADWLLSYSVSLDGDGYVVSMPGLDFELPLPALREQGIFFTYAPMRWSLRPGTDGAVNIAMDEIKADMSSHAFDMTMAFSGLSSQWHRRENPADGTVNVQSQETMAMDMTMIAGRSEQTTMAIGEGNTTYTLTDFDEMWRGERGASLSALIDRLLTADEVTTSALHTDLTDWLTTTRWGQLNSQGQTKDFVHRQTSPGMTFEHRDSIADTVIVKGSTAEHWFATLDGTTTDIQVNAELPFGSIAFDFDRLEQHFELGGVDTKAHNQLLALLVQGLFADGYHETAGNLPFAETLITDLIDRGPVSLLGSVSFAMALDNVWGRGDIIGAGPSDSTFDRLAMSASWTPNAQGAVTASIGTSLAGLTVDSGLIPAAAAPLLPSRFDLALTADGLLIDKVLQASFEQEQPMNPSLSEIITRWTTEDSGVVISMGGATAGGASFTLDGDLRFDPTGEPFVNGTLVANVVGIDAMIEAMGQLKSQLPQASVGAMGLLVMKGYGVPETLDDGTTSYRYELTVSPATGVQVNGTALPL